ncbi:MAG TPA: LPS export ABC transporter ATP-binding protein [Gemmatimonadales bacterium]|nr:LPS export ABC transporter ATP-binding protein [Gemmatimonadales bacterium]
MTLPSTDALAERDPSLAVALAALAQVAGAEGSATPADLVLAYRELYLTAARAAGAAPLGELSADELRENLFRSVLPRLVDGGWVREVPDGPEAPVRAAEGWWREAGTDRAGTRAGLLAAADAAFRRGAAPRGVPVGGSLLRGEELRKTFKKRTVVKDVSVEVRQGEIVGLLGPNGAGKTTTFYLITGLILPDRGRVRLDDTDLSEAPMYRRARAGIGYLAQEPSIFRRMTVEENVLAILETLPLSRAERMARLETLLDELSIKHLRKNRAYSLSGGERRRLEITRALVTNPKFMLLDEPFAGVDPIAVHDIQTIVAGLRHRGIGVLITDHNVEQTLDIVDRAYIMFDGRVQVEGPVRDLVFDDRVASMYFGPTLTARLRARLEEQGR